MADCSLWQSKVTDRGKGYFEAVTSASGIEHEAGMDSEYPECQGGYTIPKATPKRCVSTVKSQPEPRLALKKLKSIRT